MSQFRVSRVVIAAFCAMAWTGTALAVTAGTYSGTAADGSSVSFTVGKDSGGKLAVISAYMGFNAKCKGAIPSTFSTGWGFDTDAVIKNDSASFVYGNGGADYFYVPLSFSFSGTSVTGKESFQTAILVSSTKAPGAAEFCYSASQAYSATLAASPSLPILPQGAAIRLPARQ